MKKLNVTSIEERVNDFKKRDYLLISNSGVVHTCYGEHIKNCWIRSREKAVENFGKLKKQLKPDFIAIDQDYSIDGYDIQVVEKENPKDSYLSINIMQAQDCYRVSDFNNKRKEQVIVNIAERQSSWYNDEKTHPLYLEIRIYKDKKIAYVLEAKYGKNRKNSIFYVFTSDFIKGENNCYYRLRNNNLKQYEEYNYQQAKADIESENGRVVVESDEEIRKYAFSDTTKGRLIERRVGVWGTDLRNNRLGCSSDRSSVSLFSQETKDIVENFFDYNAENNKKYRDAFDMKYCRSLDGYHTRAAGSGIISLDFLECWLLVKPIKEKTTIVDDTEMDIEELYEYMINSIEEEYPEEFSNNGSKKDIAFWQRINDRYICCLYKKYIPDNNSWYDRNHSAIFAFDLKKSSRKFGYINGSYVESRIPSLNNQILSYMNIGVKQTYNRSTQQYEPDGETSIYVLDGLTAVELFAKTNVSYLVENLEELKFNPVLSLSDGRWSQKDHVLNKERFSNIYDSQISMCYLIMLATTGNSCLEQLLKSKLFKLYFFGLESELIASNDGSKPLFDIDKKHRARYHGDYTYNIAYHGKAKNLKTMFGLSMNQMRTIEEMITIKDKIEEDRHRNSSGEAYQNIPYLCNISKSFGLDAKQVQSMDQKNWKRLLEIVKDPKPGERGYYKRVKTVLVNRESELTEYVSHIKTLDGILKFYETYSYEEIEKLKDYLNMRRQMQTAQDRMPDQDIFNEKTYPEFVGKAKKFIPYIPGMRDTTYSWGNYTINSESDFSRFISQKFVGSYASNNSVHYVNNDRGLVGALIMMSPAQHMCYLHDEMSRWLSFYQDASKAKGFAIAVERVIPFEYVDEDEDGFDLRIVAPREQGDLKQEGSVLSHCVASYIDPVINGTENILFIRRNDMPGAPYFTMDLVKKHLEDENDNNYEIRQIHCYCNGDPTPAGIQQAYSNSGGMEVYNKQYDIIGFVAKWIKWMLKKHKVKVTNLVSHYGALCAQR